MKIEHTLSPTLQATFRELTKQSGQLRAAQLQALGQAKEAELQQVILQTTYANQIQIIQATEQLPESIRPYQLSEDGTKLIGETADKPAAAPNAPAPVIDAIPQLVNGSAVEHGDERQ